MSQDIIFKEALTLRLMQGQPWHLRLSTSLNFAPWQPYLHHPNPSPTSKTNSHFPQLAPRPFLVPQEQLWVVQWMRGEKKWTLLIVQFEVTLITSVIFTLETEIILTVSFLSQEL